MASTADIIGVYIAVDITAATGTAIMAITVRMATTAIAVPMGITATSIVPTGIMAIGDTATMGAIGDTATMVAIGDTATMAAIGPIAGTGRGVHIVVGADKSIIRTGTEL